MTSKYLRQMIRMGKNPYKSMKKKRKTYSEMSFSERSAEARKILNSGEAVDLKHAWKILKDTK